MKLWHLLVLSAWGASACAENTQYPPITDDSVYQSGEVQSGRAPSSDAMLDLLGRVEQLQNEVNSLRGQVEEQTHALDEVKRRQDNIYTDVDERLQKLEGGISGNPGPTSGAAGEGQPRISESQTVPESQADDESANGENKQEFVQPSLSDTGEVSEEQPKSESTPDTEQGNASQTAAPIPGDEKQLYQSAYSALKGAQYDQAIVLLKQLANDYPKGEYADNAYYWLGETYKIKRDADASRSAFEQLVNSYPTSPKVPDALLKLGFIELEQNNPDKARELFNTILKKYAGSSAANLATNKLQQMDRR